MNKDYNFGEDVRLVIGDEKQPVFYPRMKIKRWDNEVNFSVGLISKHQGSDKHINDRVEWTDEHGTKAMFYEKDDKQFEFEVELSHKPKSNVLHLSIETKGLNFYYQPELTESDINNGCERPDNVVGSYAVYHKTMQGNYIKGNNYRAGKFCHIYRPYATDSNGWEVWCDLNIEDDMQITIPQDFINDAVYPIVVDPTFGCDPSSPGGSTGMIICIDASNAYGSKYTGSAGTGVSMSVYGAKTADNKKIQMKLYDASENEVVNGTTNELDATTLSWHTSNFSTGPTLTAQNYWLACWTDTLCPLSGSGFQMYYDDGDAGQGNTDWDNDGAYNNWSASCTPSGYDTQAFSIYCTYSVAGGANAPTSTILGPIIGPLGGPI